MVKLSDIDLPMIFKNKLLFRHGFHNNLSILPEEIAKSVGATNWDDQRNRSLYFAHTNRDAQKWVGRVNNPHVINGELFGDLEIHDADLAMKLGPGRAPIGVSAEIRWPPQHPNPVDFSYRGFAMVPNPEVPETMVNFSQQNAEGYNTAKIHTPFTDYKVEGDNNADFDDGIITSETARGSQTGGEVENSNLMSAERGLNKEMENNANNVDPEVKEEVKEEVVETVEEEVKEEAKAEEEKSEEAEESKEAEFAAFNDKFEALSNKVKALEENFAKFSEESEESEETEDKEEAKEDAPKEEEAKAEEKSEEAEVEAPKEEVKEEAPAEEEKSEEAKADFSEIAKKIDKLADAIKGKEAAPMSTAEFGAAGNDKETAVIDRLTNYLKQ